MQHTKFQGHRPFGSGVEEFLRFLLYIGVAAILVMWPGMFEHTFVSPTQRSSVLNLTLIGSLVSEEKMFKWCGRRTDDGRTTEAYLSYKLTILYYRSMSSKNSYFDPSYTDIYVYIYTRTTEAYLSYKLTQWAFGSGELKVEVTILYYRSMSSKYSYFDVLAHHCFRSQESSETLHPHVSCALINSKQTSNDQELIQSDPISCPHNQKGNN